MASLSDMSREEFDTIRAKHKARAEGNETHQARLREQEEFMAKKGMAIESVETGKIKDANPTFNRGM